MNPGPLDEYLRELERVLRARGLEPSRLVDEAREHLVDAVEDGLRRGLAREDAERDAIDTFGPPDLIAGQATPVRSRIMARLTATLETVAGRWRWLTAATAAAAVLASALSYLVLPTLYRSESMIAVIPQPTVSPFALDPRPASQDRVHAITRTILSDARLDPILKDLGLGPAEQERRNISVVMAPNEPDTGDALAVFTVGFQSPDPQLSQKVTERLTTLFIVENLIDAEAAGRAIGDQFRVAKRADLPRDPLRPGMAAMTVSGAFAGLALSVVTLALRRNPPSKE